jgi:hypothetical protein
MTSMLIDDRVPPFRPPSDERPVWEPNPRTTAWVVAAVVFTIAGVLTGGFPSFVLLCLAIGCGAQALTRVVPDTFGLRDYHQ